MRRYAALAAVCLVAAAFAACGGGGDSAASQSTASTATSAGFETGPLKVVGGGSSSYRIRGHHVTVPGFGEEAGEAELKEAAATVHGYLVARVEKDWASACSDVSKGLMKRLAAGSAQFAGEGCTTILAALTVPGPEGSDYESSEVEAESLRAKGKRAFLLYRAATAPYFLPMVEEGGAWKVDSLAPTPFY